MAAAVDSARATYLDAARRRDAGRPYSRQASVAKLVATDAAMKVTTDAVQVLGGYGYTRDFPVERYMREAKITQIFEGTNQIQRLVISRSLVSEYAYVRAQRASRPTRHSYATALRLLDAARSRDRAAALRPPAAARRRSSAACPAHRLAAQTGAALRLLCERPDRGRPCSEGRATLASSPAGARRSRASAPPIPSHPPPLSSFRSSLIRRCTALTSGRFPAARPPLQPPPIYRVPPLGLAPPPSPPTPRLRPPLPPSSSPPPSRSPPPPPFPSPLSIPPLEGTRAARR